MCHLFLVETSPSQESPAQTRHASLPDVTDTATATGQAINQFMTPSEIALRALSPEIEEFFDVDIILPHLLKCHLLTEYDEQLDNRIFPRDRRRKTQYRLITMLHKQGPEAFDLFVKCLIDSSEGHSNHRELAMKLKAGEEKGREW